MIFDAIGFELDLLNEKQSTFVAPDSSMFNLVPGSSFRVRERFNKKDKDYFLLWAAHPPTPIVLQVVRLRYFSVFDPCFTKSA